MTQCKNKHTGTIAEYLRTDYVKNYPNDIRVHVLLMDGKEERWNDENFNTCWKFLPPKKNK